MHLLRADLERRRGRFERAERLAEGAREVLERVGATAELAEAFRMLGMIRLFSGAVAEAVEPPPPVKRTSAPAKPSKATGPAPAPPPASSRRERPEAALSARKTTGTNFRQARAPRTGATARR